MSVNSFNAQNPPVTTKGDLFTFSTIPTRLGVGANNTVLTADSAEATGLKWATVSAGGYTEIASGSYSGTALSISSIPTTYKELVIFIDGYNPQNGSDGDALYIRFNSDTNNRYGSVNGTGDTAQTFSSGRGLISSDNDDIVTTNNIIVRIPNYATTAGWKIADCISVTVNQATTTNFNYRRSFVMYNQTTAISALQFTTASLDTFGINYKVYGVA